MGLRNIVGVHEIAKILGVSHGTVKNMCASGKIAGKKIGKTWVVDKENIFSFMETDPIEEFINGLIDVEEDGLGDITITKYLDVIQNNVGDKYFRLNKRKGRRFASENKEND